MAEKTFDHYFGRVKALQAEFSDVASGARPLKSKDISRMRDAISALGEWMVDQEVRASEFEPDLAMEFYDTISTLCARAGLKPEAMFEDSDPDIWLDAREQYPLPLP